MATTAQEILRILEENAPAIRGYGVRSLGLFGSAARGAAREGSDLRTLQAGEIIEQYPQDKPYPSCLVLGQTAEGRPLHIVCAPVSTERKLIVVTVYQPDPARWDAEFKRREEG